MAEVTISELRNHGNEVLDRVALGERLVITRSGKPIAELRPVPSPLLNATTLVERRRTLPVVDPDGLRSAVDHVVNAAL
ncbi:MAG: type II toxin-antitoxin system prevent-host-death family antitoxin [Actinomycetota bacterium]|nr:type II toxin-antitoxin system prevent-host-death family antitoxin [Actinomycetota bacterium]